MSEVQGHILIVDDNVATRYALRRALEHRGYAVDEAGSGAEGLQKLRSMPVDALILDVNLPDMLGFDIVRQLRGDPATALLPIINVSAAAIASGDMVTGLDAGADAYLIHPVDPDVLLANLRTLLRVRRAEDALRRSEASFREIFENAGAPIAVVDATLQLHECNRAFKWLTGMTAGASLQALLPEAVLAQMRHAISGGQRWQGELVVQRHGARDTEWRLAPYGEGGQALLLVQDVTAHLDRDRARQRELDDTNQELAIQINERRRAEQQLAQAQKMDALGQLTGGIAHDFNNLLTSIIGGVDMGRLEAQRGHPQRVVQFLDIAAAAADRAAALTQRMLAFARKKPLDAGPFDVNVRVQSLEDMLRRSTGENVRLELSIDPQPQVVVADDDTLDNVIINLVVNARDALTAGGGIRIVTAARQVVGESDLQDGDYVEIRVSDNGSGIPADVIDKVFDPFFTTKPVGKGTGLGLSMAYGFARQSGGTIRIASVPGEGTDVTLLLPRGELPLEAPAAPPTARAADVAHHILLVDDTDLVRTMASEVLVDAGYRVSEAGDGVEALELLATHRDIALLLTDMGLPGMNGHELAQAVRAQRPQLPVLFVTGYAEVAVDGERFLQDGMDLLAKPYSLKDLLGRVQAMLA